MSISFSGGAITNVTIYGGSTGAIAAITLSNGTTPYTVSWTSSSGATTISDNTISDSTVAAKSNLKAGTYRLSVTDADNATAYHDYVITQPTDLTITAGAVTDINVYGASTGAIAATTIAGGTSPYTVSWVSGTGASTISSQDATAKSGLKAGTYTINVTDANGDTASHQYTISQVDALEISPGDIVAASTDESADGEIGASTISGGLEPYTIVWSTSTGTTITSTSSGAQTGLKAATYRLTVTDDAESSVHYDFIVPVQNWDGLTFTPGSIYQYCHDGKYLADIRESSVSGGTTYTIKWTSSGERVSKITDNTLAEKTGLHSGKYTVSITSGEDKGCTHTFIIPAHARLYRHAGGYSAGDPLKVDFVANEFVD